MSSLFRHGCLIASVVLVAALGGSLAGCSPWATYPPVEVKPLTKVEKPTYEPVPTVIAFAVTYTQDNYTAGRDLPINLPDGNWELYDDVFRKLPQGGRPMMTASEPAISIKEVRTRALEAEVDVVYTRTDGVNQLVTLQLEKEVFGGWELKRARVWQIRDVQMPAPTYLAPTPGQLIEKKKQRGPNGELPVAEPNTTNTWPSQPPAATQPTPAG